jgi:hypothetical protein
MGSRRSYWLATMVFAVAAALAAHTWRDLAHDPPQVRPSELDAHAAGQAAGQWVQATDAWTILRGRAGQATGPDGRCPTYTEQDRHDRP